ncbi:hypothetical protein [Leucobacter salsicius]|uniref:hypothetical protein n=1 Tax=Leucobacter salsicius TaxID=664638 RepID=UPI00034824B2|nr:hypothetical protein [Leucobacter salsicius]
MSIITLSEIRQAARYYAGHRVTKSVAYVATASLVASAAIGVPQLVASHAAQTDRVATVHSQIAGQLDTAKTARATLAEQIADAEKVAEQAGKKGALPENNGLHGLRQAIADAETQLVALDEQTTVTKKANANKDSTSWFPHVVGAQADDLAAAFNDLRAETVTTGKTDLSEITDTVRAEIAQKATADKQAAEEAAAAATQAAEEEAAAAAAQAAEEEAAAAAAQAAEEEAAAAAAQAAEADAQPQYAPQAPQQTANVGNGGGGSCRAQAEGLVASLSGARVVWADLGVYGMAGAGQVMLFAHDNTATLSSGTDDAFWCTPAGGYVAAHEAAHVLNDQRLDRLWPAGYTYRSISDAAETAADCIANGWGYTGGATYGCDAAGQDMARLILG